MGQCKQLVYGQHKEHSIDPSVSGCSRQEVKTEWFWKTQTYGRPYITHFFHSLITRELHYDLADVEERAPEKRSIVVKAIGVFGLM